MTRKRAAQELKPVMRGKIMSETPPFPAKKRMPKAPSRSAKTARPAQPVRPQINAGEMDSSAAAPSPAEKKASAAPQHFDLAPMPVPAIVKAQNPARDAEQQPGANVAASFRHELLSLLPSLRAFAVSLSGRADRADDLLQDTIMRAWAKQSSFTQGTNMKAWLFTILRNEFYSQMRKQGREVQDTDGYFSNNLAVHPAQYGSLDLQDFKIALDKLPNDQREAIILIGASGFSYEEAANICHCALGTIKSRVSRARTRLANLLGIENESDYGPDASSAPMTMRSF